MKSARPLPARFRSLAIGVRAAGAMALALRWPRAASSAAAATAARRAPAPGQADPVNRRGGARRAAQLLLPAGRLEAVRSATSSAPRSRSRWTTASPTATASNSPPSSSPRRADKKGSLLVNPGGPGGSGYDFVRDAATTNISEKVRSNYDIVGFDPRGVKRSAPVTCLTDKERDASRAKTYALDTDAGLDAALADNKAIAAKCAEKTGPVLGHVDTVSAAKDLDILRAVLNDTKLNYLGYSYGTFLGSTYASLFPDNVGRMVLDGAMDPSLSYEELTSGQAKAFEKALRAYVGELPAEQRVPAQRKHRERRPADPRPHPARWRRTRCRPRTAGRSRRRPSSAASSSRSTTTRTGPSSPGPWRQAMAGDGTGMLRWPTSAPTGNPTAATRPTAPSPSTPSTAWTTRWSPTPAAMRAEDQQLRQLSPTLGYYFAYGGANCKDWPYKNVRTPAPVEYKGSAPIVVVGTTGDPATPVNGPAPCASSSGTPRC